MWGLGSVKRLHSCSSCSCYCLFMQLEGREKGLTFHDETPKYDIRVQGRVA